MPAPAPTQAPDGHPGATCGAADHTARYRAILDTLIHQAADLARMVHEDAQAHVAARQQARAEAPQPEAAPAPVPPPAFPDPTTAFERRARTVRRCIAQAEALARPAPAKPAAPEPAQSRTRARMALIRGVEDAICVHARCHPRAGTDALRAELAERLDDPALEFDLAGRSTAEVIEDICRDLGIAKQGRSYVWQRRTPADIAHLRARAEAAPGQARHLPPPPKPLAAAPAPRRAPAPQAEALPPDLADMLALATQLARNG